MVRRGRKMHKRQADPVTVEVVRNLLMSIAEETNTVYHQVRVFHQYQRTAG